MIVEFIVIVMLAATVAVTLTRTEKTGMILASVAGTAVALIVSLIIRPLPSWSSAGFDELVFNRIGLIFAFAFAASALGKWTRNSARKPK